MRHVPFAALALAALAAYPGAAAEEPPSLLAGRDVDPPKRTKFVSPVYPAEARARGLRGIVILEILIDERGKVASVTVARSVPPFDEAAVAAARQWEYEVTQVEGKPVRVRYSLPIVFALKLPEVTRADGIPELVQGVAPVAPAGFTSGAATARLTVDARGEVRAAQILDGPEAWGEALLQAIRSWRFAPLTTGTALSFRVEASVQPAAPVVLKLSDAKATTVTADSAVPPAPAPAASPTADPGPVSDTRTARPEGPSPSGLAPSASPPPAAPDPSPVAPPSPPPATQASPAPPSPGTSPARPAPAATAPPPSGGSRPPAAAAPPVEVIRAPGAPARTASAPAREGEAPVSGVRDVAVSAGVPDLASGRRPVVPPLARMNAVSGTVTVRFAVDAAGATTVQDLTGPDALKDAARDMVASWSFRRASAERVFLVAEVTYGPDGRAAAAVKRQPAES